MSYHVSTWTSISVHAHLRGVNVVCVCVASFVIQEHLHTCMYVRTCILSIPLDVSKDDIWGKCA